VSRTPSRFMSVDLPEPDGPTIANRLYLIAATLWSMVSQYHGVAVMLGDDPAALDVERGRERSGLVTNSRRFVARSDRGAGAGSVATIQSLDLSLALFIDAKRHP
jgi:hypothetical protein